MIIILKLIGLLMTAAGAAFLANIQWLKQVLAFGEKGKRVFYAAGVRIFIGLLLLAGSGSCLWKAGVIILGTLMLLSGAAVFLLGMERSKNLLRLFAARPDRDHRIAAACATALGVLLVLSV